jgi:hypothetical protein
LDAGAEAAVLLAAGEALRALAAAADMSEAGLAADRMPHPNPAATEGLPLRRAKVAALVAGASVGWDEAANPGLLGALPAAPARPPRKPIAGLPDSPGTNADSSQHAAGAPAGLAVAQAAAGSPHAAEHPAASMAEPTPAVVEAGEASSRPTRKAKPVFPKCPKRYMTRDITMDILEKEVGRLRKATARAGNEGSSWSFRDYHLTGMRVLFLPCRAGPA